MVELTAQDYDILIDVVERQIEYGHCVELTRDLIKVYDKLEKISKETTVNQ